MDERESAMYLGAISFRPYLFNTNTLSRGSLSRISSIGEDLTFGKTDFSGLTGEGENINPLRKGQTVGFTDILAMQMQTGRLSASRLLRPGQQTQQAAESGQSSRENDMQYDRNLFHMQRAAEAYQMNMFA